LSPVPRPPHKERKPNTGKHLTSAQFHRSPPIDPPVIHDICQTDPDLAAVVAAWPDLPEAIRAGILAMVTAASK
jgi:hypothetical protein